MTLVVEDGTGDDPTANSYASVATIRQFAADRGVTVSSDDTVVTAQAIVAMDYIEAFRKSFQGDKTTATNPLQWPRANVCIDNVEIEDDDMPVELEWAQSQLVMELTDGIELTPTQDGAFITEDTLDVLKTKFSEKIRTDGQPSMPAVDRFLAPLFKALGLGLTPAIRV